MHSHILLKNKDAPPVRPWVLGNQSLYHLQVWKAYVVHSAVNFANVNPKNGKFVAVQTVLQKAEIHFYLELSLKHDPQVGQVFAALPVIVVRHFFQRGNDFIDRKVFEDSRKPADSARHKIPAFGLILFFETFELGQSVHDEVRIIIVVNHL